MVVLLVPLQNMYLNKSKNQFQECPTVSSVNGEKFPIPLTNPPTHLTENVNIRP